MASRANRGSSTEPGAQGCRLTDLPLANQEQIHRTAERLSHWEGLDRLSNARNESLPQTRYREILALVAAGDAAPPKPGHQASNASRNPSTYTSNAHNPPPNPNSANHRYHRRQPDPSQSANTGRRRGIDYDLPDQWEEELGVPWEDRMKALGRIKEEGKGKEADRRRSGGDREKDRDKDRGKVQTGKKRAR